MSRESQPELSLKADKAKLDTANDTAHNNLHQEAARELSSPGQAKDFSRLIEKDISQSPDGRHFKIRLQTTPKQEIERQAEHIQSKNHNPRSTASAETSVTSDQNRRTEDKPQIDSEFTPIQKAK